jgi:hypothetical protein
MKMDQAKRGVAPATKAENLTKIGHYVAAANAALEQFIHLAINVAGATPLHCILSVF